MCSQRGHITSQHCGQRKLKQSEVATWLQITLAAHFQRREAASAISVILTLPPGSNMLTQEFAVGLSPHTNQDTSKRRVKSNVVTLCCRAFSDWASYRHALLCSRCTGQGVSRSDIMPSHSNSGVWVAKLDSLALCHRASHLLPTQDRAQASSPRTPTPPTISRHIKTCEMPGFKYH